MCESYKAPERRKQPDQRQHMQDQVGGLEGCHLHQQREGEIGIGGPAGRIRPNWRRRPGRISRPAQAGTWRGTVGPGPARESRSCRHPGASAGQCQAEYRYKQYGARQKIESRGPVRGRKCGGFGCEGRHEECQSGTDRGQYAAGADGRSCAAAQQSGQGHEGQRKSVERGTELFMALEPVAPSLDLGLCGQFRGRTVRSQRARASAESVRRAAEASRTGRR